MAETWVLNATITLPSSVLRGAFTSNGTSFTGIAKSYNDIGWEVLAYNVASAGPSSRPTIVFQADSWVDDAYRTLVFDTSPTGNLLTWLQANGVKQSDPEPETPTNSCMVDGTVYGIKTGQTLVNGTAQTIYNGRALVAGAGYDIVLSTSGFTVTITGSGAPNSEKVHAYVIINGVSYTDPATLTVEAGTTIEAHAKSLLAESQIVLNGAQVKTGRTIKYEYTVATNTNVRLSIKGSGIQAYCTVDITTT